MYITINDIKGEKRIDLSYPIHSGKEITVIKVLRGVLFIVRAGGDIIKAEFMHTKRTKGG